MTGEIVNGKRKRQLEQGADADIPVAEREGMRKAPPAQTRSSGRLLLLGGAGLVALAAIGIAVWRVLLPLVVGAGDPAPAPVEAPSPEPDVAANSAPEPVAAPNPEAPPTITAEDVLGHRPYEVANVEALEAVTADGRVRLQADAARQFLAMQGEARARGISLAALSGYRTFDEQRYLFFQIKADRAQDARERAKVSAPPGYSEHHTGYAIDIGDATAPSTHIEESFESTAAFAWLQDNAARFGFELSFPRDNEQGISYEPWHWRYVGNLESLETFYKGQSQ